MSVPREASLTPGQARSRTMPMNFFGSVDLFESEASPQRVNGFACAAATSPSVPRTRPALQNIVNTPSAPSVPPETPKKSPTAAVQPASPPASTPATPFQHDEKGGSSLSGKPASTRRKKFVGMDLVYIARAVNEKNPWVALHGFKTKAWESVNEELVKTGFRHKLSADIVRQKAEGLIGFRKNPASEETNTKAIAAILNNSPNDLITISALLDRMENDYDAAKSADEAKKAELKKKHDDDKIARDILRQAAITTQKKRKETSPHTDDEETDGSQSGETSGSSGDRPKKPRLSYDSSQDKLLAVMKEDIQARKEHEAQVGLWMQKQEERHDKVISFFEGLLKIEQQKLALATKDANE